MPKATLLGLLFAIAVFFLTGCGNDTGTGAERSTRAQTPAAPRPDGSVQRPLRVMLIPAEGTGKDETVADYRPLFDAITEAFDLHFEIRVGTSYEAVVAEMIEGNIDIAYFGPLTYYQARTAGAAEILAVGVNQGKSVYYSGIFARKNAGIRELSDLAGRSVAFGDVNSTSSFHFPIFMMLKADINPVKDLDTIYITGSHAGALDALLHHKVDAACASFPAFERAIRMGELDPFEFTPVAMSQPIPYPPLAMSVELAPSAKARLRHAFRSIHKQEEVTADMIRGYDGMVVDRYNTDFPDSEFDRTMAKLSAVTDKLKTAILEKAKVAGEGDEGTT